MDTKEAIERIKALDDILYKQEIDLMVEIFKQGERYEAIVSDIENDFNNLHCNIMSKHAFDIIKKKYFPNNS